MEKFASIKVWSAISTNPSVINLAVIEIFNKIEFKHKRTKNRLRLIFLFVSAATATAVDTPVVTDQRKKKNNWCEVSELEQWINRKI